MLVTAFQDFLQLASASRYMPTARSFGPCLTQTVAGRRARKSLGYAFIFLLPLHGVLVGGGCAACRVTRCGSGANRYELADSITDSALAGLFRAAWAPARSARLTRMAAIVTNRAMSMIPADTSNPRENPTDSAWS